ncbi:MAG: hypothetical protein M3O71_21710 [Bacteroidota bacterium]|nr:hypothetical protein [Bacteroidota bacterium]
MADLSKFQRSKERINEILNYLISTGDSDHANSQYVRTLEQSIRVIDEKMEEFKNLQILQERKSA